MFNQNFFETHDVTFGLTPIDLSAGDNNGGWVDIKPFVGVAVILAKAAGTAGQDPTFTLKQSKSNSGQDSKDLNFTTIYRKQGTAADEGGWVVNTQDADNEYTNGTLAENKAIIGVWIRADALDANNGFDYMRIEVPDVGSAAQIGCALYIGVGAGHLGAAMPHL